MQKTRKHHNFLHGATILVFATAIVTLIGAFFKIPLGNLFPGDGMGYFTVAFDMYLPMYSLAMAGLPIAISRMVAESVAENRFKDVRNIMKIAQKAFLVSGFIGFLLMALLAYPYVDFIKNHDYLLAILMIAPALLFCCIMSSYRGYYEGLRNMYPTAISQVIEALGKLFIGLGLAYATMNVAMNEYKSYGTVFGTVVTIIKKKNIALTLDESAKAMTLPYAAAAALAGITIGTILGAIYLVLRHKFVGDKITEEELLLSPAPRSNRANLKLMLAISIPIVIGSLATNISSLVDLATVTKRLADVYKDNSGIMHAMYGTALDKVESVPNFLYGCYRGYAFAFYNLVPTFAAVLGISALPNLAAAWVNKNTISIRKNIETVIRITALFSIPCGLGLFILADPILNLFYVNRGAEIKVSSMLLTILAIAAIFAGLALPLTSMLQAIGRQKITVRNIIVAVVLKIVTNFTLIAIPTINIQGAAISSIVCYVYLFTANLYCLCKYSGIVPNFWSTLFKPLIASIMCAVAAYTSYGLLSNNISLKLATVSAIAIAGIIYIISLFLIRAISADDIKMMPKGEKIANMLAKFHLIG